MGEIESDSVAPVFREVFFPLGGDSFPAGRQQPTSSGLSAGEALCQLSMGRNLLFCAIGPSAADADLLVLPLE